MHNTLRISPCTFLPGRRRTTIYSCPLRPTLITDARDQLTSEIPDVGFVWLKNWYTVANVTFVVSHGSEVVNIQHLSPWSIAVCRHQ
jgi:hypothetical protein